MIAYPIGGAITNPTHDPIGFASPVPVPVPSMGNPSPKRHLLEASAPSRLDLEC